MTDRFEDAVRDAARDLATGSGGLPTYHDAWQRGRRRRFVKRSAFAAVGALVFVAALGVNLGRFPGSDSTDVDDIALAVAAATPSASATAVPTTAPVDSPPSAPSAAAVVIPTPPTVDPTPNVAESALVAPTSIPTVSPAPTPAPTAVPTPTTAPIEVATPVPTVAAIPTATPNPTILIDPDDANTAATGTDPGAEAAATGPERAPELAFTTAGIGQPAAAVVVGPALGDDLPCDIDSDGVADATCDLLPDYSCTNDAQIRPGYDRLDTNEDGVGDTCAAVGITVCDTVGDGLGDTPCIIQFVSIDDVVPGDEGTEPPSDE